MLNTGPDGSVGPWYKKMSADIKVLWCVMSSAGISCSQTVSWQTNSQVLLNITFTICDCSFAMCVQCIATLSLLAFFCLFFLNFL